MATITNQVTSQALRGEGVIVTMTTANAISYMSTLSVGQTCTVGATSKTGQIGFIDTYGLSFTVIPTQPNNSFDGNTAGYLTTSDTVTF